MHFSMHRWAMFFISFFAAVIGFGTSFPDMAFAINQSFTVTDAQGPVVANVIVIDNGKYGEPIPLKNGIFSYNIVANHTYRFAINSTNFDYSVTNNSITSTNNGLSKYTIVSSSGASINAGSTAAGAYNTANCPGGTGGGTAPGGTGGGTGTPNPSQTTCPTTAPSGTAATSAPVVSAPVADSNALTTPLNIQAVNPTKFTTIAQFLTDIPTILLSFIGTAAIFGFLLGAYMYFIAGGTEENVEKAKTQMIGSVIALFIVLAAAGITYELQTFFSSGPTSSGSGVGGAIDTINGGTSGKINP